jgi:LuxR family maltose regulon positive regulatory protein
MGLIARARGSGVRVVAVTAPAGYGKSTLLAEWAARETRAVAWVSPDRFDDDPATLLSLMASACAGFSPQVAEVVAEIRPVGRSTPGQSALGRSAPLLAAALASTTTPFTLFVDDLQLVDSPGCRDVLEVVLQRVPVGSQVVLASRHEQPHLARLRVTEGLFEIGTDDLRVDAAGARTIFTEAQADVSESDIALLLDRCEGWPAGLFLCAVISRSGGDALATGDDRFIADYLYRECLARLPEDLQQFLRGTAVLEQLSGALCDAVLCDTGSHERLRALEELSLFLVPLDRCRGWYRYHGLFREFLLAELHRADSGQVTGLHLRAASWCESNGLPALAIEHLLAAGERDRAARLIGSTGQRTYQAGQVADLGRWLSELSEATVEAHPRVAVLACWNALLAGEAVDAERWAAMLERIGRGSEDDETGRQLASARAATRAAMCADGPQRALDDAAFAVASEPPWSPWRDQATYLYGSTLLLVGDVETAKRAFADRRSTTTAAGVLCEADLAALAIDAGDWHAAARHADTAASAIAANHMDDYSTSALGFAVAARVALHDQDLPRAERLLALGMQARTLCTYVLPFLALRARLQLSKAFATKGDRTAARALMREMDDLLSKRPGVGVLVDEIAMHRKELLELPRHDGSAPLSPAQLRLLPYLQTHLSLRDIGERLFISRNTVSTQVTAIYRKLGVTTRSAAVQRATETGLLGGMQNRPTR